MFRFGLRQIVPKRHVHLTAHFSRGLNRETRRRYIGNRRLELTTEILRMYINALAFQSTSKPSEGNDTCRLKFFTAVNLYTEYGSYDIAKFAALELRIKEKGWERNIKYAKTAFWNRSHAAVTFYTVCVLLTSHFRWRINYEFNVL